MLLTWPAQRPQKHFASAIHQPLRSITIDCRALRVMRRAVFVIGRRKGGIVAAGAGLGGPLAGGRPGGLRTRLLVV